MGVSGITKPAGHHTRAGSSDAYRPTVPSATWPGYFRSHSGFIDRYTRWIFLPVFCLRRESLSNDQLTSWFVFFVSVGSNPALQYEPFRAAHTYLPSPDVGDNHFPKLSCLSAYLFWSWPLLASSLAFICLFVSFFLLF